MARSTENVETRAAVREPIRAEHHHELAGFIWGFVLAALLVGAIAEVVWMSSPWRWFAVLAVVCLFFSSVALGLRIGGFVPPEDDG